MLNWRLRYQRLLAHAPELLDPNRSVLEVGFGMPGMAELLQRKVCTVVGQQRTPPASAWETPVAASLLHLPFADDSFDFVVCADTLKFVEPSLRARAVAELARVCRLRLLISMPCGPMAMQGEQEMAATVRRAGQGVPYWLQDRFTRQIPSAAEMLKQVAATGYRIEILPQETLLQHCSALILDMFFPFAAQIAHADREKTGTAGCAETPSPAASPWPSLGSSSGWEFYYSYLFSVFKRERLERNVPVAHAPVKHAPVNHAPSPRPDSAATTSPNDQDAVQIYAVYHQRLPLAPGTGMTPVYVGEASRTAVAGERTESELDNSRWSELSGVHEVWKNGPRSTFVGFCHYRRVFDFSRSAASARSTPIEYASCEARASDTSAARALRFFRTDPNTLVTPVPLRLGMTIWDHFARLHNTNDLCLVTNLMARKAPHMLRHFIEGLGSEQLYANNLFITRWDHFEELCTLWFDVLGEFEKAVPPRTHDRYQRRDVSFLAERVFDGWVRYRAAQGTILVTVPILEITYPGLDTSAWSRTADHHHSARPVSDPNP